MADLPPVPGGYVEEALDLGGRTVRFFRPADPDALLDVPEVAAACEADGDAPYWPLLWPPAVATAKAIYRAPWPLGSTVLEVGCGIGVVGLAAAARGFTVTVSDNRPEAVALAVANARHNGLAVEGLTLDWRRPLDRTFDAIVGCEVIYDAAFHDALLGLIDRMLAPGGEAVLTDHGRMHAPLFARRAEAAGFAVSLADENGAPLDAFRTAAFQSLTLRRR